MKPLLILFVVLINIMNANSQNVGVGLSNPLKKLSVNGSVMIDQNNLNTGTLDSAALVFGSAGSSGISSLKSGADAHDLRFWANGQTKMLMSANGNLTIGSGSSPLYRLWVRNGDSHFEGNMYSIGSIRTDTRIGIGGPAHNSYKLRVYDGPSYLEGDVNTTGNTALGGEVDGSYRLRVRNGDTRLDGSLHANVRAGIGGAPNNNYRLYVHNGESYFGGAVNINGQLDVTTVDAFNLVGTNAIVTSAEVSNLTIDGKGSVRSNGTSNLRIGFDQKTVNSVIAAHGGITVTANITDFAGDNDDIRIMISQIIQNPGNTLFSDNLKVEVISVNAVNDTCDLRISNLSDVNATASITIYITSIAKN
jgi:hypothetical protein